jgi:NADH dehydrogenase/NADH:ubiquinone oxidoreductase subunit G
MFYGVVAAMLMYTVSEMIDNEEKKEVLKLKLTNYYENELLPRLMENETSSQPELIFSKVNEGAKEQVAATLEADIKAKYQMISPQKQNAKVNGQMTAMQESGSKEKPLEDAVKILSVKAEEYVAATKEPNAEQAYNHAVGAESTDTLDSDEEPDVEEMNQKTPDYSLNQTLEEAAPKKNITDEEKRIIEEVLKEYLFK